MYMPPNQPQHLLCLAEAVGMGEKDASRKELDPSEATENERRNKGTCTMWSFMVESWGCSSWRLWKEGCRVHGTQIHRKPGFVGTASHKTAHSGAISLQ